MSGRKGDHPTARFFRGSDCGLNGRSVIGLSVAFRAEGADIEFERGAMRLRDLSCSLSWRAWLAIGWRRQRRLSDDLR
jgi:hypothetical protein